MLSAIVVDMLGGGTNTSAQEKEVGSGVLSVTADENLQWDPGNGPWLGPRLPESKARIHRVITV